MVVGYHVHDIWCYIDDMIDNFNLMKWGVECVWVFVVSNININILRRGGREAGGERN